jgi:hypothetical protein
MNQKTKTVTKTKITSNKTNNKPKIKISKQNKTVSSKKITINTVSSLTTNPQNTPQNNHQNTSQNTPQNNHQNTPQNTPINNQENIIDDFVRKFSEFQVSNNIGIVSEYMDPKKWLEVDTFLYMYLLQISTQGKIKDVIYEYGISNSFQTLFKFYKTDLGIDFLQSDSEILHYISQQPESSINTDIVLAIMRESIGFVPIKNN